jgi:malate synthase
VDAYVRNAVKAPWYVDLLNLNLGIEDLDEGSRRIRIYLDAFQQRGTRATENLDFGSGTILTAPAAQ